MPVIQQTPETADLAIHTLKRVRQAVMLTLQLIEEDEQKATVLITCAVDLINGAAQLLEDDGKVSPDSAMVTIVASVLTSIDNPKIQATMKGVLAKMGVKMS